MENKRNGFSLKWSKLDLFIIIPTFIGALILSFFIYFFPINNDDYLVNVYYDNNLIHQTKLVDENNEVRHIILFKEEQNSSYDNDYPNNIKFDKKSLLLGDLIIRISDKKISIVKETSPNRICSNQGGVGSTNLPVICMPNYVKIQIVNGDKKVSPDDIVGIG